MLSSKEPKRLEQDGDSIVTEALPEEWAWANFLLDAKLCYGLNLDLVYFLAYAQRVSISDAARVLKVSRRTLMDMVLKGNPAFMHEVTRGLGRLEGGWQRRMILSEEGRRWQERIKTLARIRRGGDRCRELQKLAEPVRQGVLKEHQRREEGYQAWIDDNRRVYLHLIGDGRSPKAHLASVSRFARRWGHTVEESLSLVVNGPPKKPREGERHTERDIHRKTYVR